ncbi:MAG: type II secretion system F family protein, partial [Gammaproteobacteria bacterium]|nr:type II secretion system F family protein [Gammaproteobacteria bacterium]
MSIDASTLLNLLITASVFGLVLAIWFACVLIWSRRRGQHDKKVEQRLAFERSESNSPRVLHLWHDGKEATTAVPERIRPSMWKKFDQQFVDAGWDSRMRTLILTVLAVSTPALALLTLVFFHTAIMGLGIAAASIVIFCAYLKHRVDRQAARFERQLVDSMDLAARALRAGHPLIGAFTLIAEEIDSPVCDVFAEICQQQELGLSMEEAIRREALVSSSSDMKLFATSVIIQVQTGGNLAD